MDLLTLSEKPAQGKVLYRTSHTVAACPRTVQWGSNFIGYQNHPEGA